MGGGVGGLNKHMCVGMKSFFWVFYFPLGFAEFGSGGLHTSSVE